MWLNNPEKKSYKPEIVWNTKKDKQQQMLLLYKKAGIHITHVLHSNVQDTHFQ